MEVPFEEEVNCAHRVDKFVRERELGRSIRLWRCPRRENRIFPAGTARRSGMSWKTSTAERINNV